VFERKIS